MVETCLTFQSSFSSIHTYNHQLIIFIDYLNRIETNKFLRAISSLSSDSIIFPTDMTSSAAVDDMPLSEMLETTSLQLTNIFDPTDQARLLYNITCENSLSDQIIYVNKALTTITYYEQHDLYGKDFDVFCGELTNRSQLPQMRDEVRRKGKAESEMILYDRKNKPFRAKILIRPVITTDDFDELIISFYVIDITRLPEPKTTSDSIAEPINPTIPIIINSKPLVVAKSLPETGEENSAKTSAPSFSTTSPSVSDLEEESVSNLVHSNSDSERTLDQHSLAASRNAKRKSFMNRNEDINLEDGKRLTKDALQELDDRSWEEVNNTKRRKFIDSK